MSPLGSALKELRVFLFNPMSASLHSSSPDKDRGGLAAQALLKGRNNQACNRSRGPSSQCVGEAAPQGT
jgi:hypothetical protein